MQSPSPARIALAAAAMANAVSSGFPALDDVLAGGFPRGRFSAVVGPCNLTMPLLRAATLAAQRTAHGSPLSCSAWVDGLGAFSVLEAAHAGVDLSRLLVAEPLERQQEEEMVQALLRSGSLDLLAVSRHARSHGRLARAGTAALVCFGSYSPAEIAQGTASVVVELSGLQPRCQARVAWHEFRDDLGVADLDLEEA